MSGARVPLVRVADCPRCGRVDGVRQRATLHSRGTYRIDGGIAEPPEVREQAPEACIACGTHDRRPWTVAEEMTLITTSGLWAEEDFKLWA